MTVRQLPPKLSIMPIKNVCGYGKLSRVKRCAVSEPRCGRFHKPNRTVVGLEVKRDLLSVQVWDQLFAPQLAGLDSHQLKRSTSDCFGSV